MFNPTGRFNPHGLQDMKIPTLLTKQDSKQAIQLNLHDVLMNRITIGSINIFTIRNCCSKLRHHNSLLSDLMTNFKFFLVASSPVNPKISELML